MKYGFPFVRYGFLAVAPHEGAWIEIRRMDNDGINLECEILRKSIEH